MNKRLTKTQRILIASVYGTRFGHDDFNISSTLSKGNRVKISTDYQTAYLKLDHNLHPFRYENEPDFILDSVNLRPFIHNTFSKMPEHYEQLKRRPFGGPLVAFPYRYI